MVTFADNEPSFMPYKRLKSRYLFLNKTYYYSHDAYCRISTAPII